MAKSVMGADLLTLLFTLCHLIDFGSSDYCKSSMFIRPRRNTMKFSKELSETEFGVVDEFKSLHCCSRSYKTIEWFKDGIPYPWSTAISTLIISPESRNQTIYSQGLASVDSGDYWCIVRNATHFIRHNVTLNVIDPDVSEVLLLPTYHRKTYFVSPGDNTRLYCEAFLGNVSNSDSDIEIEWRKEDGSLIPMNDIRFKQFKIARDKRKGLLLTINGIKESEYGRYVCQMKVDGNETLNLYTEIRLQDYDQATPLEGNTFGLSNDSDKEEEKPFWTWHGMRWLKRGIVVVIILVGLLVIYKKCVQHRFYFQNCSNQGCLQSMKDVLILHHPNDRDVAVRDIASHLGQLNYNCNTQSVTLNQLGSKELRRRSNLSKRVIVVLSPSMTEGDWSCYKVETILRFIIAIHSRIITVFLKVGPFGSPEEGSSLENLLRYVYRVEYKEANKQEFWDSLQLGLPVDEERVNVKIV